MEELGAPQSRIFIWAHRMDYGQTNLITSFSGLKFEKACGMRFAFFIITSDHAHTSGYFI